MRQKLLLLLLGVLSSLPALTRDFNYTYKGQTLTYTVIDEDARTCMTKEERTFGVPENNINGDLIIPEIANDGTTDYSVTAIGKSAFNGCLELTSVVIPNSVTAIGDWAFNDCRGLTSVVIPNSVTAIGDYSFCGCNGLTSLTIGNSVSSIGGGAFYGCIGLTSLVIPNSVTSIGDNAFTLCNSLESLAFYAENCEGSLYGSPFPSSLKTLEIGDNVTKIPQNAFYGCSSLTSVKMGKSVTIIGPMAFYGCVALASIEIPNSVTLINSAFGECRALKSLDIPNSVTTILGNAFYGCTGLTSLTIGNSVELIDSYAFAGCSGLRSVTIPPSVTQIYNNSFQNCSGLIKSAYPNNLSNPFENGVAVAYDPDGTVFENGWIYNHDRSAIYFAPLDLEGDYILPETVTSIGESAFYGCGSLASVKTLSETPASMPVNAFDGLYETVSLTVPDVSVYKYLATAWGLFKNIQTNAGNELPYFSDGNLEYRLNPADRTATVTGAKNYSSLSIPESFMDGSDPATPVRYDVRSIGVEAFKGKDVNSIDFDPECKIEFIGDYAFADTEISSIMLPASVTVIGNHAFHNTPDLYKVELNEGLASIGDGAFAAPEIRYGKTMVIPSTVDRIGADAFYNYGCSKVGTRDIASWCRIDFGNAYANPIHDSGTLYVGDEPVANLRIPEGLEEIKPYAFYNCYSLEKVAFPEGLKRIGLESFYGCVNISDLRIPSSVVEIGERVFANNTVTFSDGLSPIDIKDDAFYYGVQTLYWGRPLDGGMVNLQNIRSLEIGGMVTDIPDGRFKDCQYLSSLTLGNGLKTIGNEAFSGCTWLWEIILPPSVETIGASAFAGDSSIGTIIMGHNVKTIGERAFNGTAASTVSITAQIPPTAPNNTFSKYEGRLYLQGEKAVEAYSNASTCWNRFDSYVMITPTGMDLKGAGEISGKPGDTFQLTARLMPENVTLPQIFWRSTNPAVATVDQNGLVTLHADNVEATSRAKVLASCKIIAESLYVDGPVAEVSMTGEVTGIGEIVMERNEATDIDYSQPYEIYNINGLKVSDSTDDLSKGIYIIRQGNAAVKTVVK